MERRHFIGMLAGLPLLPVALYALPARPLLKATIPLDTGYGPLLIGNPMDSGWRPLKWGGSVKDLFEDL